MILVIRTIKFDPSWALTFFLHSEKISTDLEMIQRLFYSDSKMTLR